MVQVKLEVRTGAARFRVSARASTVQRAVSLVGARYPGGEVRLISPVESSIAATRAKAGLVGVAA